MKWMFRSARQCFASALFPLLISLANVVYGSPSAEEPVADQHQTYACISAETPGVVPVASNQICGKIYRPLRPNDVGGELLEIHYLRLPATGVARAAPIVFLQGGPGGDALSLAWPVKGTFRTLNIERDFIFVDLRGTGKSGALDCEDDELGLFSRNLEVTLTQTLRGCLSRIADRAPFYTTSISVDDLESLRHALGVSMWSLWSVSYGGRVALDYMKRYPTALDSVVLDSPAPVAVALPSQLAPALDEGLQMMAVECAKDTFCKNAIGDPYENAKTLMARLQKSPDIFIYEDKLKRTVSEREISAFAFAHSLNSFFYSRLTYSHLAEALSRAVKGDWTIFIALEKNLGQVSIASGLHYAVICNEDKALWPKEMPQLLGESIGSIYAQACDELSRASIPPEFYSPIVSDVPTLIFSGARDRVTPTALAQSVQKTLSHSQLIEVPQGTHAVSFEGCIPELITRFFMSPLAPIKSGDCENRIQQKPFYKGGNEALIGVETVQHD